MGDDEAVFLVMEGWVKTSPSEGAEAGYVRNFLIFTKKALHLIETDNISHLPPWETGTLPDSLRSPDLFPYLVWGPVLWCSDRRFRRRAVDESNHLRRSLIGLDLDPSVEATVRRISSVKGRIGVRTLWHARRIPLESIKRIKLAPWRMKIESDRGTLEVAIYTPLRDEHLRLANLLRDLLGEARVEAVFGGRGRIASPRYP